MKIIVIGISGMLGHKIFLELRKNSNLEVYGILRNLGDVENLAIENNNNIIDGFSIKNIIELDKHLEIIQPDFIINCTGIIKQSNTINKYSETIRVNSLFPHQLSALSLKYNSKLIHFSTDCVFSGMTGKYKESDHEDATDLYGRSKLIGEVAYDNHLTFRTSMIGHELKNKSSLLEWFLKQEEIVNGFSRALFSGLPTICIAKIVEKIITDHSTLNGLYHLSAKPINKYELLKLIKKFYSLKIEIKKDSDFVIDRSLDSGKFFKDTGIQIQEWQDLIQQMHQDFTSTNIYEK